MKVLVTGTAGFIGMKTAELLLRDGEEVVGIDNLNNYYDIGLKRYRLNQLQAFPKFKFYKLDIENKEALNKLFAKHKPQAVINLAARAGVRASLDNPYAYFTTNVNGTLNLLELCRKFHVKKFVLASTSSLYAGQPMPYKETADVKKVLSPYAASKRSAEILCNTYHFLYGIDVTILRYFTVYGPAGRPDMSPFKFIQQVIKGRPVIIYGDGGQSRDFTYVDDIARGTILGLKKVGFKIINLGNNNPCKLNALLALISKQVGQRAKVKHLSFQKTDIKHTRADIGEAKKILGWRPQVSLEIGLKRTIRWHKENERFLSKISLRLE